MNKQINQRKKAYNSTKRSLPIYRRAWFYIVIVLLIAVLTFGAWFFFLRPNNSNNNSAETDSSSGSVPSGTDPKGSNDSKTPEEEEEERQARAKTPTQYDGDDPNKLDEITGFVSYAAVNGDHLSIRLTINQYLEETGTCELTMTNSGHTVTGEAETWTDASTSTCQGFDIPLSEFSVSGTWQISIKITAGGKTGTITGEVSL